MTIFHFRSHSKGEIRQPLVVQEESSDEDDVPLEQFQKKNQAIGTLNR